MSDPSGISSIGQNAGNAQSKGQVVQIVSLPEGLEQNARAIRIQGEVTQQNKDGSVRISTPQGDIDIQVRGREPQPGQRIEIDIPPGNPPRQASIRPAAQQPVTPPSQQGVPPPTGQATPAPQTPLPQTPVARPVPDTGYTPPVQPQTPVATPPKTPLPQRQPVDFYQPSPDAAKIKQPVQTAQPLPSLTAGQTVKLIPAVAETLQTTTPQTPGESTQAKPTNLVSTLLQTVKSAIPQALMPIKSAMPVIGSQIAAAPVNTGIQTPIPQTGIVPVQSAPLFAKIISIEFPTGQISILPSQTGNAPQIASPISPVTVTVSTLSPQGKALIPIPIDEQGGIKNFIIQTPTPSANIQIGTKITFMPQLSEGAIPTPTNMSPAQGAAPQTSTTLQTSSPLLLNTAQPTPSLVAAIPPSSLPPAWRPLLPLMQPSMLWPAMDDLFQAFYQATPQAAQILGRIIPSPANTANFGPALLLFAAAMKSGDLQAWLGDKKSDMLQKLGKAQLASRLSGETSSLAGQTDAPASEWKSLPIPMLWQNEISKVMFHVRKEHSEDGRDAKDSDQTRFVMDLSLSKMGDVQLDGMVRGKQVDLIVRTQMPVSFPMQDAMRTAYAKALDRTDIYGEIGFQSNVKEWAHILKREDNIKASV